MTRRRFCEAGLSALAVGIPPIHDFALPGDRPEALPIPSLDELATKWLDCEQLAHMPSMHNFHEMAACGPDLVGVNFLPGHRIYKASGPRWFIYNTLPICRMSINGESPDAAYCQWTAYEARRRATVEGIEIVSTTRLASEANAILWRVRLRNGSSSPRQIDLSVFWKGRCRETEKPPFIPQSRGWIRSTSSSIKLVLTQSANDTSEIESQWRFHLPVGASHEIRFQMCVNTESRDISSR